MITPDDIKLGIELNGLDETLKRVCDIYAETQKDYIKVLNSYNEEMVAHITTKIRLYASENKLNNFKIKSGG